MNAYITSACRTAIGKFNGSLASLDAIQLGTAVTAEALARAKVSPAAVEEVIFGNIIQAGLGQNPARQIAIKADIPYQVPSFTVNKVCGSGLKSVALAAQAIACGDASIIVAGGTEHMTNAPYLLKAARWGQRMGNGEVTDSIIHDALWDKFYDCHMAITAENIAERYSITREEQDEYSAESQQKTEAAIKGGKFIEEIVPIRIKQHKSDDLVFDTDEHQRFGTTAQSLAKMKAAFKPGGTVTAGNASGINDGAAAVVVVDVNGVRDPGYAFKIVAVHSAGLDPAYMGLGPIYAVQGALKKAKLTVDDIDLFELNEAFAVQSIGVKRGLRIRDDRVNVNGGAIALGHPVGASGTRILVTLIHSLLARNLGLGVASLCIGGGQGIAMVIERIK